MVNNVWRINFCKQYVTGEPCYCLWDMFLENARNIYGGSFYTELFKCRSKKQIIALIHTII